MRSCNHCSAVEGEKSFSKRLKNICDSCARMRARDRCVRCNGPKFWGRCGVCDPPPKGKVQVILLNESTDHERIVYRSKDRDLKVSVAGRRIIAGSEDILVVTLSRKEFLKTLC